MITPREVIIEEALNVAAESIGNFQSLIQVHQSKRDTNMFLKVKLHNRSLQTRSKIKANESIQSPNKPKYRTLTNNLRVSS